MMLLYQHGRDVFSEADDSKEEDMSLSSDFMDASLGTFAILLDDVHTSATMKDLLAIHARRCDKAKESSHRLEGGSLQDPLLAKTLDSKIPEYVEWHGPSGVVQINCAAFDETRSLIGEMAVTTTCIAPSALVAKQAISVANFDRIVLEHMKP